MFVRQLLTNARGLDEQARTTGAVPGSVRRANQPIGVLRELAARASELARSTLYVFGLRGQTQNVSGVVERFGGSPDGRQEIAGLPVQADARLHVGRQREGALQRTDDVTRTPRGRVAALERTEGGSARLHGERFVGAELLQELARLRLRAAQREERVNRIERAFGVVQLLQVAPRDLSARRLLRALIEHVEACGPDVDQVPVPPLLLQASLEAGRQLIVRGAKEQELLQIVVGAV